MSYHHSLFEFGRKISKTKIMQLLNCFLVTLAAGINTSFYKNLDYNQLGVQSSAWRPDAKIGIKRNVMISSMMAKSGTEKTKQGNRQRFASLRRKMFARYHAVRRH